MKTSIELSGDMVFDVKYSIGRSAFEMTYIVSSGALNSTHSLTRSGDKLEA